MNAPRFAVVAAVLVGLATVPLRAQTNDLCAGHWEGTIELPGTRLAFDVDLARSADKSCTGDISIPQQSARDVALVKVAASGDSVRFTIGGIPGEPTFTGVRGTDARTVTGTFSQSGGRFPFRMAATASRSERAEQLLGGFDAFVDSARVAWDVVGLSIGIIVDGKTVYLKGHGERNKEKHLPVTPQTLFAIGSSSKAFTTFAMGALVDQGKLQWDVPVRSYLPWFRMHDASVSQRITPRDLVTHRSGLPRHDLLWYNNTTSTREELVRRIAYLPLNKDLRETFQYNNLMFLTAGYLVGSITGTTWENGLRQLVLDPLGMKRTNFSVAQSQADPDHSLGYRLQNDSIQRLPFRDISLIGPAGSINSSAEEMLKWVGLHLANGKLDKTQVIQSSTLKDMYRPYTPISGLGDDAELGPSSYGMGWFIDTYRGRYRAQHGGNIDGFTASVTLLPRDGIGIVVLVNQNGAALGELVTRHAMDRLLGAERRDWSGQTLAQARMARAVARSASQKKEAARIPNAPPAHPLAAYAGTYADSGYGAAAVTIERDTLRVTYNGISAKLQPWHFETFSALRNPDDPTFTDAQFSFRTSTNGRVDALVASMEPNVPPIVFLRQPDASLLEAANLQPFTGRYQIPGGPIVVVALRGNALFWTQGGAAPTELAPEQGTRFVVKAMRSIEITFTRDASGKITGARVVQPGAVTDIMRVP